MLKHNSLLYYEAIVHGLIHKAVVRGIFVGVEPGSIKVIMFVSNLVELIWKFGEFDSFFKDNKVVELEVNHTCVYKQNEVLCM